MSHFKRKRSRREIKCALCTPFRWLGNTKSRFKPKEYYERRLAKAESRSITT